LELDYDIKQVNKQLFISYVEISEKHIVNMKQMPLSLCCASGLLTVLRRSTSDDVILNNIDYC